MIKKAVSYIDPYSVVDYMKSKGMDSSMSARKTVADTLGIKGYKGTGEQNTQMLNKLKSGGVGSAVASAVGTAVAGTGKTGAGTEEKKPSKAPTVNGVDSSVADTLNSTFTASTDVKGTQKDKEEALGALNSIATPSVSKETMDALNTPFSASSAYLEAMEYTNALREKLSSGRTSYTDQIQQMMDKIQNREKFSYDVESDTLFQQALASAMGSGKQAMQDTIGQASALTGGYGSTYATSAGNQAYNAYIEDAYNNLPEYYQMAMDAYNMEGQEMYNQLGMLNDADATEYGRMYDSWNVNFQSAQNMYNQEYGAWQDSVNNAYNSANLQLKEQGMAYDQAYNNYQATANNADVLYSQEYQQWQDKINNAYNVANLQNRDYWSGVDNDYRYDAMESDNQYRYDAMENSNEQNRLDRQQNQNQFNAKNSQNAEEEADNMATLSTRELKTVETLYKKAGGGDAGYEAITEYLDSIGKSDTDFGEIDALLYEVDETLSEESENLPVWEKEWTIAEGGDTYNGGFLGLPFWQGEDGNDVFTDGNRELTFDDLKKMLDESDLSAVEKKAFLKKLSDQSKN